MNRIVKFAVLLILVISTSNFPNLAQADSYSDTIDVFKKSKAVKPFLKNAYVMRFFQLLEKEVSVFGRGLW